MWKIGGVILMRCRWYRIMRGQRFGDDVYYYVELATTKARE